MRSRSLIARPANVVALSLLTLSIPVGAAAQTACADTSLSPGARVRIVLTRDSLGARDARDAPSGARRASRREIAYVGTLIDATSRSIVLRPDRSADTVEIAHDSIARAQLSRGNSRGGRMGKAFLIGAVFGAGFGFAVGEDCGQNDFICFDRGETVPLSVLGFGGLGALLGAITWREQWIDAPRISIAPSSTGSVSMRAAASF